MHICQNSCLGFLPLSPSLPDRRHRHADGALPLRKLRRGSAGLHAVWPHPGQAGRGALPPLGHGLLRAAPLLLPGAMQGREGRGAGAWMAWHVPVLGLAALPVHGGGRHQLETRFTSWSCAFPRSPPPPQALPLMPSPWFVLGAELLQGATFALVSSIGPLLDTTPCMPLEPQHHWPAVLTGELCRRVQAWAAGTVHVKRISPPHLRSTVQSIFQVGCCGGAGSFLRLELRFAGGRWCILLQCDGRRCELAVTGIMQCDPAASIPGRACTPAWVPAWAAWLEACCMASLVRRRCSARPPSRWPLAGWPLSPRCGPGVARAAAAGMAQEPVRQQQGQQQQGSTASSA